MRPELIEKIKRLADDARGDPATFVSERRKSSRRIVVLISHLFETPKPKPSPRDPRVHGMRTDPVYDYYVFTDLASWDKTKNGNLVYTCLPQRYKLQDRAL